MSTLHVSPDGREMLDLVDKLRNIDKIEKTIPLPQIVVVGQQSCGKSSVLHAISGIQFPRDDGVCTQFPTEIILRREKVISTKAFIRCPTDVPKERQADYKRFEQMWSNTSLDNLRDIIADAKTVLQLNDRKRFSPESLVLEVSGPNQEHLSLIDLPGFFVSTQINQNQSDIALVNDIAKNYISKERAIILAVVSGKNDFENQKILEDLKNDEHSRRSTLGVITAPDAIEVGSRRAQECINLLQKDPRNFGYGWHVLRNLKYSELLAGTCDRDGVERQFFEQQEPWNSLQASCVGNQALKTRLSSILIGNIAQSLPEIQQEVDDKLDQIKIHLDALGQARASPDDLREYLCERAYKFEKLITDMLSDSPPTSTYGTLSEETSLRASVETQLARFADEMFDKGRLWVCRDQLPGTEPQAEEMQQIYAGDMPGTKEVLVSKMVELLLNEIQNHRGKELLNLLHPGWASTIFRRQSKRWPTIAKHHCNIIFNEVQSRVSEAVYSIADEHTASRLFLHIVQPALMRRKEILDAKLEELHRPYTLPGIHCLSRGYRDAVNGLDYSRSASMLAQCFDILRSAEAYYDVACEVFTENVINLGIENCLVDDLQSILSQRAFCRMSDEDLDGLGSEPQETKQRRSQLMREKEQFEEARGQILPSLGRRRHRLFPKVERSLKAVGKSQPVPSWSVAVTEATPPATPHASPNLTVTPTKQRSHSRNPLARSTSPETNPGSPSTSVFSNPATPAHSQSADSMSSYQGTPARSPTKSRTARATAVQPAVEEEEEEL